MENLNRTRIFLDGLLSVFSPTSVRLLVTETKLVQNSKEVQIVEYFQFLTTHPGQRSCLRNFLRLHKPLANVHEVSIVTIPGTIRVHSASYVDRVPNLTVNFMGLDIDILRCFPTKASKLQTVTILQDRLKRTSHVQELNIKALKDKWNDNPTSYRIPLPYSVSNRVCGQDQIHFVQLTV